MRPVDFNAVKQLVSMETTLRIIGWRPRRFERGKPRGPCPVCKGRSKDNRIFWATENGWYCHKCKRGGNQLQLFAAVSGLPLLESAYRLCELAEVMVPVLPLPTFLPRRKNSDTEKRIH